MGLHVEEATRRGRKSSPGSKSGSGSSSGGGSAVQYQSGLSKKSSSTSQLSATGNRNFKFPHINVFFITNSLGHLYCRIGNINTLVDSNVPIFFDLPLSLFSYQ